MTLEKIKETANFLKNKGIETADVGIILGTGMGEIVKKVKIEQQISYDTIPNFPISTMELHKGVLIYGILENKKVIILQGRFHLYEGYNSFEVSFPVRILHCFNINYLIINNIAGAVNLNFKKGDIMLLEDHINLQVTSPLAFKNAASLGNRFVDMICPYDKKMRKEVIKIATENNISIREGIYAAVIGPQLETRAEYRYLKIIKADAVGMSTVPEVIVANQLQIPTIAFSILTDECDPDNLQTINIEEILSIAKKTEKKLTFLIAEFIKTYTFTI